MEPIIDIVNVVVAIINSEYKKKKREVMNIKRVN